MTLPRRGSIVLAPRECAPLSSAELVNCCEANYAKAGKSRAEWFSCGGICAVSGSSASDAHAADCRHWILLAAIGHERNRSADERVPVLP
jgi:hypothetical protein